MFLQGLAISALLSSVGVRADPRDFAEHDLFGAATALSDQVNLNPPLPNQMGALWAKHQNNLPSWMVEVNHRVNGPDHGGKGLAIWYTKSRGQGGHIYGGPDNWDGLGLFLTAEPDGSGALRGHLNDGSFSFARSESPEKHAFGACNVMHRNVGTISSIKLVYNVASLKVYHNDALCFENVHINLPEHYFFGVSSQSGEIPDAHEIFGFKVGAVPLENAKQQASTEHVSTTPPATGSAERRSSDGDNHLQQSLKDIAAELAQLKTRSDRIDTVQQTLSQIQATLQRLDKPSTQQSSTQTASMEAELKQSMKSLVLRLDQMGERLARMTDEVQAQLKQHQSKQSGGVYLIIIAQAVLFVLYAAYRKRREEAKSKFL